MVRTVKTKEKEKKKVGRKPKLIVEDQILMTLQYLREYRLMKVIADKGYQGIAKIHQLSETPIKKKKGRKLTKEEKNYNRQLNRLRVTVEHINRRLKIFKILSSPYRNRGKRFGLRANLIAGLHNYDLAN